MPGNQGADDYECGNLIVDCDKNDLDLLFEAQWPSIQENSTRESISVDEKIAECPPKARSFQILAKLSTKYNILQIPPPPLRFTRRSQSHQSNQ
jgi:hypothetical protein